MAHLNWTDQSIIDFINIADFISKDSVRYAKTTVKRIRESAKHLNKYPYSGRMVPEIQIENLRELIIGNYRLIYFINLTERIDIITVHHSAKRLDTDELINIVS